MTYFDIKICLLIFFVNAAVDEDDKTGIVNQN